jgi:hypothetical protein
VSRFPRTLLLRPRPDLCYSQLLDLLLDLNTSLSIPHELRFDLSLAPKSQQPQEERDMNLDTANNIIANAHRAFHNHEIPQLDFVRIRQDIEALLARKNAKSLVDMEAQIPYPRYQHSNLPLIADANPAFLSSSHEDAYLTRLDNKLEPAALSDPRPASPQPLSKLTQRELDREVELRNPLSVHNWLKKHGTISDIDAASEGGNAAVQTPATANKRRNLAKQVGDKAIERAREKEGSPGSTVDNEDEPAGDDTPGKPKKSRDDDQTYRPKGGRSKSKRKREEGETTPASARGKKQRTSLNIPSDA